MSTGTAWAPGSWGTGTWAIGSWIGSEEPGPPIVSLSAAVGARLELYSDLACAGGSFVGTYNELAEEIDCIQSIEENTLRFTLPRRSRAFRTGALGQVVRLVDQFGEISEWPITNRIEGTGPGRNTVTISCGPVVDLLGRRGLVRDELPGGRVSLSIGFVDMTPTEIIETYILGNAADDGLDWIGLGTIDFTQLVTHDFTAWTRLQLIDWLAEHLEAEWRLRRDGETGYLIDMVSQISALHPTVLLHTARNVRGLDIEEAIGNAATVLIPLGGVPDGGLEPAKIDETMWEIAAIAGNVVTVEDPDDAEVPIRVSGQWVGNHLRLPDGTTLQITDSAPPGTFTVADIGTAEVGMKAMLTADFIGTALVALTDPATSQAPPTGLGHNVGTWVDDTLRGEANFIGNAFARNWADSFGVVTCRARSTFFSTTTIQVKDIPPDLTGTNCTAYIRLTSGAGTRIIGDCLIGSELLPSLPGEYELILSSAVSVNLDDEITLYLTGATQQVGLPSQWSLRANSDVIQRRMTVGGDLACVVDGTQTNVRDLAVRGLTDGDEIGPGDQLISTLPLNDILGPTAADGSGNATIALRTRVSLTDGAPVVIRRPNLPAAPGTGMHAVVIPRRSGLTSPGVTFLGSFNSPSWFMPHDPSNATIVYSVGLTYLGTGVVKSAATGSELFPARLALREPGGGAALASATDIDRTLDPSGETHITLRGIYTQAVDKTFYVTVEGLNVATTNWTSDGRPLTVVRWIMLHRGPEASIAPVAGSHGNRLLGVGNRAHARLFNQQGAIEVPYADFAAKDSIATQRLNVRGSVRAVAPELALDTTYKIAVIRPTVLNPLDSRVTLVRRLEGFTELALSPFKERT